MMKPGFFNSLACRSGAHCPTCREPSETGRRWRLSVAGVELFDCPLGKPMGDGSKAPRRDPACPRCNAAMVSRGCKWYCNACHLELGCGESL